MGLFLKFGFDHWLFNFLTHAHWNRAMSPSRCWVGSFYTTSKTKIFVALWKLQLGRTILIGIKIILNQKNYIKIIDLWKKKLFIWNMVERLKVFEGLIYNNRIQFNYNKNIINLTKKNMIFSSFYISASHVYIVHKIKIIYNNCV